MIHRSSALMASCVVPQADDTLGNKRASSYGHRSSLVSATHLLVTLSLLSTPQMTLSLAPPPGYRQTYLFRHLHSPRCIANSHHPPLLESRVVCSASPILSILPRPIGRARLMTRMRRFYTSGATEKTTSSLTQTLALFGMNGAKFPTSTPTSLVHSPRRIPHPCTPLPHQHRPCRPAIPSIRNGFRPRLTRSLGEQ